MWKSLIATNIRRSPTSQGGTISLADRNPTTSGPHNTIELHLHHSLRAGVLIQAHCWSEWRPRPSRSVCSEIAKELVPLDDIHNSRYQSQRSTGVNLVWLAS
ncbi:hypothetical protein IG631_04949 [Alternaria alternata]|nr:hypothetical protein IG631_04949 [Alternaria alternata]